MKTTKDEKKYDVVIYDIESGIVSAVIGANLHSYEENGKQRNSAEERMMTGLSRINENYSVDMFPAGTLKKGDKIP